MMPHNERGAVLGSAWLAAAVIIAIAFVLAILPMYATADVLVQRVDDGYVFAYEHDGKMQCWGMPAYVDLKYFPTEAMSIADAAKQYNWPEPQGNARKTCLELISPVHLVTPWQGSTERKVYALTSDGKKTDQYIGDIPVGTQCGAQVQCYYSDCRDTVLSWRRVTLPGGTQQGVTVCKRQ